MAWNEKAGEKLWCYTGTKVPPGGNSSLVSASYYGYPLYLKNWEQGARLHLQDILITTTNRAGMSFSVERSCVKRNAEVWTNIKTPQNALCCIQTSSLEVILCSKPTHLLSSQLQWELLFSQMLLRSFVWNHSPHSPFCGKIHMFCFMQFQVGRVFTRLGPRLDFKCRSFESLPHARSSKQVLPSSFSGFITFWESSPGETQITCH